MDAQIKNPVTWKKYSSTASATDLIEFLLKNPFKYGRSIELSIPPDRISFFRQNRT